MSSHSADLDVDLSSGSPRPVHLRLSFLAIVALGGAIGTAAREGLALVIPVMGSIPVATVAANILGAFLLGVLLEALARRGPDEGRRRTLRLLLGTGVLGGFTTYSALTTDTMLMIGAADVGSAALYALGTITVGALVTWAGVALAAAVHRRRVTA